MGELTFASAGEEGFVPKNTENTVIVNNYAKKIRWGNYDYKV